MNSNDIKKNPKKFIYASKELKYTAAACGAAIWLIFWCLIRFKCSTHPSADRGRLSDSKQVIFIRRVNSSNHISSQRRSLIVKSSYHEDSHAYGLVMSLVSISEMSLPNTF